MSLGFGYRARIGHLYPSGGLCDYEPQLMAPDGIQFVTTRLPFAATAIHDVARLFADVETHAALLADADVDIVAVNCTAATLLAGPHALNRRIAEATGLAAVTTIEAVLTAVAATRLQRVALLTPYPDAVVRAEIEYFRTHGVDVVVHHGLPRATPVEQAEIPPEQWRRLASAVDRTAVDGLVFSCAGIRISTELEAIEHLTGLPVVASNQALLWYLLLVLDIHDRSDGYGSLLAGVFDPAR